MPAPIAASIGSLTTYASRAPAFTAASITARFSVDVTPAGTEMSTTGLKKFHLPSDFFMKYRSMASVTR